MIGEITIIVQVQAAVERQGVLHDVAVVTDHVDWNAVVGDSGSRWSRELTVTALPLNHVGVC